MSSPLSYSMFADQDIFSFVNPNDLHHIYKDEIQQSVISDTSWNLVVNPQEQMLREKRSKSLPSIPRSIDVALFTNSCPPLRSFNSVPQKAFSSTTKEIKGFSVSDSSLEDNGMEFFDEESLESCEMEAFNEQEEEQDEDEEEELDEKEQEPEKKKQPQPIKRAVENEDDDDEEDDDEEDDDEEEDDEEEDDEEVIADEDDEDEDIIAEEEEAEQTQKTFKLQSSKSPVIDALVYCALMKIGLTLVEDSSSMVQFRIHDFPLYYNKSAGICSKANPTDDVYSRVKALQRWFPDFPTLKEIGKGLPCIISLSRERNYKNFEKLQVILERQKLLLKSSRKSKVKKRISKAKDFIKR